MNITVKVMNIINKFYYKIKAMFIDYYKIYKKEA